MSPARILIESVGLRYPRDSDLVRSHPAWSKDGWRIQSSCGSSFFSGRGKIAGAAQNLYRMVGGGEAGGKN